MEQDWNSVSEEEVVNGCGEGHFPCLSRCASRQAANNTQSIIQLQEKSGGSPNITCSGSVAFDVLIESTEILYGFLCKYPHTYLLCVKAQFDLPPAFTCRASIRF